MCWLLRAIELCQEDLKYCLENVNSKALLFQNNLKLKMFSSKKVQRVRNCIPSGDLLVRLKSCAVRNLKQLLISFQ